MVLFKNAIRHSGQKNITDTPLGPALVLPFISFLFPANSYSRVLLFFHLLPLFWENCVTCSLGTIFNSFFSLCDTPCSPLPERAFPPLLDYP